MDHALLPLRSRTITAAALLIAAMGCEKPAAKPAAAVSPKACEEFAARICKETTDTSPTCTNLKSSLELLTPETCSVALSTAELSIKKLADKRKKCDELTTKLCKDIGDGTETCTMVKTTTKTFPPERCEQMLGRYAEVLDGLKKQEERNKPLSPEKIAKLKEGAAPQFGPATSKVTIVEFSDFQCPYCSRAATAVHELKEKYGDKVHFVFRQFPLSFHQNAHISAEAALAAHAQGKFWEFHDKLFANQSKLDRASLEGYAKELNLNVNEFKKALDDKTHAATVDAELKLGEEVAVDGTPTMFLNGKRVGNPTDVAELSKAIDEALNSSG
ncbi:MAG: thioredoxin domain-containing protein [Polyangiales bacterium]